MNTFLRHVLCFSSILEFSLCPVEIFHDIRSYHNKGRPNSTCRFTMSSPTYWLQNISPCLLLTRTKTRESSFIQRWSAANNCSILQENLRYVRVVVVNCYFLSLFPRLTLSHMDKMGESLHSNLYK